ncbi:MAG TPA: hypothetical protein VFV05_09215 [Methylomirabilota bacterium]|nr:hypothetical protein [Methylomirabilota bacterium]
MLIEPDGEGIDLALELAQAVGQSVAFLAEGFGQRYDGVDEPAFTFVGGRNVAHRSASGARVATEPANRMPRDGTPPERTWRRPVSPA